jgi:zinc protease
MRKLASGCVVFAVAAAALVAQTAIVKHPSELKFAPRNYVPPAGAPFRHTLANGATAFLVEDHEFPLINIHVTVRTGDYLDPEDKTGLAGFTGSQMRAGGTKTKSPAEFDEEAAFLAANISSNVSDLSGGATLNCLKKDIDAGLALFVDMLRNPGFDEGRLKIAKSQIYQAMERRNDSTQSIEGREFQRLMRGEHHFSARQETRPTVDSITRDDLIAFHDKYYYPSNFIFAVSGDFDTKEMIAKLDKAFGGWPNHETAIPEPPKPGFTPKPGVYLVRKADVNQGRVRMGHLGVTLSNPDHIPLEIMNGILGGNVFSSRILERVRSDEGLAYSAGSRFDPGTYYEGVFFAAFQSKSASVAQATAIVMEEIERMRSTKVTAEELTTAVNSAIESLPLRFATASQRAGQFASDAYTKRPADYWQKYTARVKAVTPDEIQRVAQKYLHPEELVILAVGDVDAMLKGNPDKSEYSLMKFAGANGPVRIPLPDPMTLTYPAN